ncbi:DUF5655 domain-containing protein [Cryobacterium arcticum]|uniref:DUF5655 domain-containing protein n=1 Tax=Cryobacterium arcticum TaxID=670052 RepID=A0A317ZYG1_9MICO|nr:DUF5655 domain-containing protein [Cryobacterium arcticum]PXA72314.1 hypothetical protein CTB96_05425 [Cryobacterium arcticum]
MTDEQPLPWAEIRLWEIGMLQLATGSGLEHWLARIRELGPVDEHAMRDWLTAEGVTGYPRSLLVHETFGYPHSTVRAADELIDAQYADRPTLRPILDAVLLCAGELDDVSIQTRTSHVALTGPKRTFAVVQPTTRHRVDLGLRIELPSPPPSTRLRSTTDLGADFPARIGLASPAQVDAEVAAWLKHAYDATL